MRALHAEAQKRGLEHEDLRDIFKTHSLSDVPTQKLQDQLKAWTGKSVRRVTALPRKGCTAAKTVDMVTGEDLTTLADAFAIRGWGVETQKDFIRRQLRGRDIIRTRADFHRVFSGVRAMNRRDGK